MLQRATFDTNKMGLTGYIYVGDDADVFIYWLCFVRRDLEVVFEIELKFGSQPESTTYVC